jgi:hypothetical protein
VIQITPLMRILLAVEPVDLRKGIDGLAALCRQKLSPSRSLPSGLEAYGQEAKPEARLSLWRARCLCFPAADARH